MRSQQKNGGPIADSLGNFCRKIHQRCVAAAKFTWSCHHFNDHNSGHFNCLRRCKKLSEKKASKPWELTYPTWGSSENHLQNAHSEGDMDSFPGGYIYIITIWYILMVWPQKKNCSDFLWMFSISLKTTKTQDWSPHVFWKSQMSLEKITKFQTDSDRKTSGSSGCRSSTSLAGSCPERIFPNQTTDREMMRNDWQKNYLGEVFFCEKHP